VFSSAAPLLYAYSNRVCAVTPFGVPSGTPTTVQVEYKGQATVPVTKSVARSRLAIFTADNSGSGQASALNDDGSPNSTANPAPRGSIVTVYATGGGLLTPQCPDGQVLSDPPPRCVLPVTAQIGGQDADVQFAGGVPNQVAGLVQAQVRVPMSIELGPRIPIVLRSDGWNSGVVVTIAVK